MGKNELVVQALKRQFKEIIHIMLMWQNITTHKYQIFLFFPQRFIEKWVGKLVFYKFIFWHEVWVWEVFQQQFNIALCLDS